MATRDSWPHCDGPNCGRDCACECATCTLLPTVLANLNAWASQLRSAQLRLDLQGGDREQVAVVAGSLLDLAEGVERSIANLRARFT